MTGRVKANHRDAGNKHGEGTGAGVIYRVRGAFCKCMYFVIYINRISTICSGRSICLSIPLRAAQSHHEHLLHLVSCRIDSMWVNTERPLVQYIEEEAYRGYEYTHWQHVMSCLQIFRKNTSMRGVLVFLK